MANSWKVTNEYSLKGFMSKVELLAKDNEQVTFSWRVGRDRSLDQNRMCFELYSRIGTQLYGGDTARARAECKLTIGVPLMRASCEDYRAAYDKVVKPHDYETKIHLMGPPLEFPVTSQMGVKQCKIYIDTVINTYTLQGVDFSAILGNEY